MYNCKRWVTLACLSFALTACSSKPVEIEGFDAYVWKRDKWGCARERASLVEPLLEGKDKIRGLREAEVVRLLGKPDLQELYTRNQKFLIYLLEPNRHCTSAQPPKAMARALHIRLNAMGLAQEFFVKNLSPEP